MNRATSEKGKNLGTDQQSGPSDALSEIAPKFGPLLELFLEKVRFWTKSPIFGHDESSDSMPNKLDWLDRGGKKGREGKGRSLTT